MSKYRTPPTLWMLEGGMVWGKAPQATQMLIPEGPAQMNSIEERFSDCYRTYVNEKYLQNVENGKLNYVYREICGKG